MSDEFDEETQKDERHPGASEVALKDQTMEINDGRESTRNGVVDQPTARDHELVLVVIRAFAPGLSELLEQATSANLGDPLSRRSDRPGEVELLHAPEPGKLLTGAFVALSPHEGRDQSFSILGRGLWGSVPVARLEAARRINEDHVHELVQTVSLLVPWDRDCSAPVEPPTTPPFRKNHLGKPIPSDRLNITLALKALGVRLSYDEFACRALVQQGDDPPRNLDDDAVLHLRFGIDVRFGFKPGKDDFVDCARWIAQHHRFHPVRDYLAGLIWDGEPRIDRWLSEYGGAPDTEFTRAVGGLFLVAAVRRARRPGCKFDEMIVLESQTQGTIKSEAIKALSPRVEWFSDDLPVGAEAKEVIERTDGKWLIECAELSGMQKREVQRVKAFLSRSVDGPARLAYGRLPVERPRQFVTFGTTNDSAYLKDSTGNRRFWPACVTRFDVARLRADRDQLWAEAAHREAAGESIRLKEELWPLAGAEQEKRRVADAWEQHLADKLGARDDPNRRCGKLTTEDAWAMVGKADPGLRGPHDNERLGNSIRALGFEKRSLKLNGKNRESYVRFPDGEDDRERRRRDPVVAVRRLEWIKLDGGEPADGEERPSRRENGRLLQ